MKDDMLMKLLEGLEEMIKELVSQKGALDRFYFPGELSTSKAQIGSCHWL